MERHLGLLENKPIMVIFMERTVFIWKTVIKLFTRSLKTTVMLLMIYFFCYLSAPMAQNNFEILIPWENDTCVSGFYAREIDDSSIFILGDNYVFDPGPGLPIEGPAIYGTGLIKVSQYGNVVWKKLYKTNELIGYGAFGATGRVPATCFYPIQNSVIIPFSMFLGAVMCDSMIAEFTYKTGIVQADMSTGSLTRQYLYYDDTLCSQDNFSAFAIINDSTTIAIESGEQNGKSYVIIRTISDSLISKYPVDSNYSVSTDARWSYFYERVSVYQPADSSFILIVYDKLSKTKKIVQINSHGAVTELFPINYDRAFKIFNNSFYFLHDEYDSLTGKYLTTLLVKLSGTGIIQKEINFNTMRPVDFEFTSDAQMLFLCDKTQFDPYDSIPQPVRVLLIDTNLIISTYNDYGFAYVAPTHITYNIGGNFIVTGTRLKSVDEDNGKEPDQVYLLKSHIDSINIPYTNISQPNTPSELHVKILPNPATDQFTVEFQPPPNANSQFTIFNYTGKEISRIQRNNLPKGKHQEQFNTEQFSTGIYFFVVNINGQIQTFKILKM